MFQTKFHIGETLPGKNYIFQLNTTHSCTIDIKTETLHRTAVEVALFYMENEFLPLRIGIFTQRDMRLY